MSSFQPQHPRERLIVALDVPSASDAHHLARELRDEVGLFKVGLELFCAEGPDFVKALGQYGRIFLDLKFLDIPHTVVGALRSVLRLDPYFLTVHATGGRPMMQGVTELLHTHRQSGGQTRSLAVSVLTSFGDPEWHQVGQADNTTTSVVNLGRLAHSCGMDGAVCSPHEAQELRKKLGDAFLLVCPGIRPTGSEQGDQVRVSDPVSAVQAGADYLVVGRPITAATHPREAARALVESLL